MILSTQISLVFISSSVLMISIFFKWILSTSRNNKNFPPSPPKLPIIGNLHEIGSNPHHSFLRMAKKHGPLMLVHLGSVPMLVASTADVAEKILKTHDLAFCSRPILKVADTILYGTKDIAFRPYGEHWRQMKNIAVLQLLSHKRVQSFRKVREEETALMIKMIGESCGSLVNLSELFVSLTNSVVCRVAWGKAYRGLKFKKLLEKLMDVLGTLSVGSYIPWLWWMDHLNGLERKTNEVAREFDELVEDVLQEHMNKKRGTNVSGEAKDVVDILLDAQREKAGDFVIDNETIKAVILEIFAGGTHASSTNLEWAISELVKHPLEMKKLQEEVTNVANGRSMITEDDLDKMKYLKAVIKETFRSHIPLPLLVQRECIQDVKLMGYDITKGTRVVINAWALARDPSLWEDPEEFKPERFLNSSIDYKGFHYELIPFGSGRRGCPGIQFATAVIELAVANLVYKYDFTLPDGKGGEELDMSEITGLTTHRKSPLLFVATPRF